VKLCLPDRLEPLSQFGHDLGLRKIRWPLVPVVVHDVFSHHVREICRIGVGESATRHPSFDAGDILENGVDGGRNLTHPQLRSARGKLSHYDAVSLVLGRQKRGWMTRKD